MFQSDALKTSESSWSLEETLYVEIIEVKKLFENEVTSKSLDVISHNNENSDDLNNIGNLLYNSINRLQKTILIDI